MEVDDEVVVVVAALALASTEAAFLAEAADEICDTGLVVALTAFEVATTEDPLSTIAMAVVPPPPTLPLITSSFAATEQPSAVETAAAAAEEEALVVFVFSLPK